MKNKKVIIITIIAVVALILISIVTVRFIKNNNNDNGSMIGEMIYDENVIDDEIVIDDSDVNDNAGDTKKDSNVDEVISEVAEDSDMVMKDGKYSLFTMVDTEEEAREIADKLGIEFESYAYEIATYLTDKNPHDVVEEAKKLGLPDISINSEMHLD